MTKIVVLLPTYNERENIRPLLTMLEDATVHIKNHTTTFLVIDDSSPDGTDKEVRKYSESHKNIILITGKKEGLGKAILKGMKYAVEKLHADIVVQMDADLSHDPHVIPQFLEKMKGDIDFVVGSRYIPGGSIPDNWGIHRKIFSIVANAFVRFGIGIPSVHDWTGGFRAYRSKFIKLLAPRMDKYSGYLFQIAFLHKSIGCGAHVAEVPIHFTDRRYGRSKIAPAEYIQNIIKYVISARLNELFKGTFIRFAVVGSIGFVINTVFLEIFVHLGFAPWISSALGAECAIVSNFILNNYWTFKDRAVYGVHALSKFAAFNFTSIGAVIIQSGTVGVGTFFYGHGVYRIFYILGVAIGLIWNYIMYSRVIWKK